MRETDNRDASEMLAFYEARIEALGNRVRELETRESLLLIRIHELETENVRTYTCAGTVIGDRNAHLGAVEA